MSAGKHWTAEGGTDNKRRRISMRVVLVCVGISIVAGVGYGLFLAQPGEKPKTTKATATKEAKPEYESVQGRYLMNGTIFWGRAIEKWSAQAGGYDYARPFSALDTFSPEQYDAWVADLECPVLDTVIPYTTQVATLQFNCRPEYLTEAAKYFDIIDLANNHTGDKGEEGFQETRRRVTDAGMQAYGNYDPGVEQDRCEVISLPVRLLQKDKTEKDAELPVAFCAYHYFGRMPRDGELEYMKQYSKVMPVFAFVHMGTEYLTEANTYQVEVAHKVVEQGAEFVVLNNPHWVQNTEVYKDTLIFYSTGNFIFDQIDKEGMRSASLDVTMSIPYNDAMGQWVELSESCEAKKLHDQCFATVKQQKLTKPKLQLTYDVVAGDNSGKLTKRANPAIQAEIEQRTNWADTLQKLGQAGQ
jgi:hypothetical protein